MTVGTDVTSQRVEPPWWCAAKASGRRRKPLTRDAIVAVKILDADGANVLAVRRLGEELGTGSATLHWHISGKDELGEIVYDRVMGEVVLPTAIPCVGRSSAKNLARHVCRIMLRHNDLVRLSLGHVPVGPNMARIIEWNMGLLRRCARRSRGIPRRHARAVTSTHRCSRSPRKVDRRSNRSARTSRA